MQEWDFVLVALGEIWWKGQTLTQRDALKGPCTTLGSFPGPACLQIYRLSRDTDVICIPGKPHQIAKVASGWLYQYRFDEHTGNCFPPPPPKQNLEKVVFWGHSQSVQLLSLSHLISGSRVRPRIGNFMKKPSSTWWDSMFIILLRSHLPLDARNVLHNKFLSLSWLANDTSYVL